MVAAAVVDDDVDGDDVAGDDPGVVTAPELGVELAGIDDGAPVDGVESAPPEVSPVVAATVVVVASGCAVFHRGPQATSAAAIMTTAANAHVCRRRIVRTVIEKLLSSLTPEAGVGAGEADCSRAPIVR